MLQSRLDWQDELGWLSSLCHIAIMHCSSCSRFQKLIHGTLLSEA